MIQLLPQHLRLALIFILLGIPTTSEALLEEPILTIESGVPDAPPLKGLKCENTWTDASPFLITDSYGNNSTLPDSKNPYERNWDNFRYIKDSEGVSGFIPQRTIVRLINNNHKKFREDQNLDKDKAIVRVPVEVINVPEFKDRQLTAESKSKKQKLLELKSILTGDSTVVRKGQVGRLDARVLQPAGRFTYLIKEDTFFQNITGLDDNKKTRAKAVELVAKPLDINCTYEEAIEKEVQKKRSTELANQLKTGKDCALQYNVNKCCLNGNPNQCTTNYIWKILDADLNEIGAFEKNLNAEDCDILDHLRPIDKNQAKTVLTILELAQKGLIREEGKEFSVDELQYIDSMGLIKFPFDYYDSDTIEGPFNTSAYNPDCGEGMCDFLLNVTTACTFGKVLEEWNDLHPEEKYEVQIGDMWHPITWKDHRKHEKNESTFGTCIDLRPLSSNSDRTAINVKSEWCDGSRRKISGDYDKKQTREFISLAKKAGASQILFGGSGVGATIAKCHGNHIHLCFEPNNPKVKKACEEGI